MKKILILSLFLFCSCAPIVRTIVVKGVDIASPYLEKEIPIKVEKLLIKELKKQDLKSKIKKFKERFPLLLPTMSQGVNKYTEKIEDFFNKKLKKYQDKFFKYSNILLKKYHVSIIYFDINKDGDITFNEYIRLYLYLDKSDRTNQIWRASAHTYLTWKYIKNIFVSPGIHSIQYFFKQE